ncbi:carbonic anhydrase 3-like [Ceratina calcarata]|uniref:Carbonic anhydrase 3-like n=1 Tax=Ceratina calcarata TaxID=156304 RepID=A0AAJ7WC48_9HYME|nr:carbonic anhydrase 3-like [Ceratina calcarata]
MSSTGMTHLTILLKNLSFYNALHALCILVEVLENKEENVKLIQTLSDTDGTLEGPIDLDINNMKVMELDPLEWTDISTPPRKLKITNTGYTVILSAKWQQDIRPYISGGPFTVNYVFSQVHFHWGENEMTGSEHTIDGGNMPMEVHVVLFRDEYESLELALRRPNGVSVIVYFCKVSNQNT